MMKDEVLNIINQYPKHYTKIIKGNQLLNGWVIENSYESENYAERIYVATLGVPNKTPCGIYPKFNTYFKGFFEYCGSKTVCECSRNDHSIKIKNITKSDSEQQEILDKRKETMLEKYGTDNAMHSVEFLEKLKKTNLEKYGVEFPLQNNEIKDKIKKTNLEKYGVEFPFQSKEIQQKTKDSMVEQYGKNYMDKVISVGYDMFNGNPFQNEEIKEKIKNTMIERYGVEHPLQSKEILDKMITSNLKKYGVENVSLMHLNEDFLSIISDKSNFISLIKEKKVLEICKEYGVSDGMIYRLIKKYDAYEIYKKRNPSYIENEMQAFLNENKISYQLNDRKILKGKELDFYIPQYNIAIEMNGVYYHCDIIRPDKNYHYNKWKECKEQGIHLISIFEDDWNINPEKIKSMLLSFFNMKEKGVPARKTKITKINGTIAKSFLKQYHLQGYIAGKHYGAFDGNNNLIGVMTFGHTRNQRFELSRFVMDNHTHHGLFSKIFNYAQKELGFTEVVSFSDNTCFTGNVYKINGFDLIKIVAPDYKYLINGRKLHKSNFKKENIKKKYPHMTEMINNGMSERKAMEYLGIPKIWDCGKCEWAWKK